MPHDRRTRSGLSAITLEEALRLPCLEGAQVLAGNRGLHRPILGVNVMEDVDIVRWLRGGELLLTTGYSLRDYACSLSRLIPALEERELAGLVVKLGLYVEELPREALLAAERLGFPVLGIPKATMFDDILSEVLGTILNRQAVDLERSNAIHARLTAVALAGGSFTELAGAVAELVHWPVTIRDAHGMALAVSDGVPDEADAQYVVRPIKVGDADHGEVVVWTDGAPPELHVLQTMEHAATIAATSIAQERAVVSRDHRHRTLLLMQLVSRTSVDRTEMTRWATAMGWSIDVPHAVVLVELRNGDGPVSVAGQPLEDRLIRAAKDAVAPDTIIWGLGSGLVLLVEPTRVPGAVLADLHAALRRALPGHSIMVAAGSVAPMVGDLSRSYEEAASTLALGRELRGDDFVLEHRELGVYRLLSGLSTEELRRHREETLGPLIEYDAKHRGALVHTLEVFIRCEQNRVRAAAELYVHYNTLRYRLTQIEQLTSALDGDAMKRLNMELALCAHRLLLGRDGAERAVARN